MFRSFLFVFICISCIGAARAEDANALVPVSSIVVDFTLAALGATIAFVGFVISGVAVVTAWNLSKTIKKSVESHIGESVESKVRDIHHEILPELEKSMNVYTKQTILDLDMRYHYLLALRSHIEFAIDDARDIEPLLQHLSVIALGHGDAESSLNVLMSYVEGDNKLEVLTQRQGKRLLRELLNILIDQKRFIEFGQVYRAQKIKEIL